MKKIGRQIFSFLASLQLAVVLLLSLAIILSVGTFYESAHDADTARYFIYGTWWFTGVLGLLGVNVLFAALSRYPWKRHHSGFLITHLGLLLLLGGSLVTLIKGYEGQLIIPEGETQGRMLMKDPTLFFYDAAQDKLEEIPAQFRFDPPKKEDPFGAKVLGDVLVKVDEYLPNAQSELKVVSGDTINPAVQIKVTGSRANMGEWLLSRDIEKRRLKLGPASVTFLELPSMAVLSELLKNAALRGPVLFADGKLIPVEGNIGAEIPLGQKSLVIQNYLPHAAVNAGQLLNLSPKPENPVVKLLVKGAEGEEQHTVFANFPELSSYHEKVLSEATNVKLLWVPVDLGEQDNELVLAQLADSNFAYALKRQGEWQLPNSLQTAQEIPTGWMDFKFSLLQSLPNALLEKKYRRVAVPRKKEGPPPAIHVSVANSQATESFWLGRGESHNVQLGNQNLKVAFALKSKAVGFELKLDDFRMGTYEGTKDPSRYESLVTLLDPANKGKEQHLISMNNPLKNGKYKIFQASYQLNPGAKDWSILAIAYDPGIFLKYLGSIVLVTGVVIIFFFRQAFVKKKKALPASSSKAKPNFQAMISTGLDFKKENL